MRGLDVVCGMFALILAAALVFMITTYVDFDALSLDTLTGATQPSTQPSSTTPDATPATPSQQPASTASSIIPKDTAQYVLSPDDLGAGWTIASEEKTDNGYYKRLLSKGTTTQELVSCQAKIFTSAEDAEKEYGGYLAHVADTYKYEEVNIGDKGFVYAQGTSGFRCIIKTDATVVMVDMATQEYGGSLKNVKRYAAILGLKLP